MCLCNESLQQFLKTKANELAGESLELSIILAQAVELIECQERKKYKQIYTRNIKNGF